MCGIAGFSSKISTRPVERQSIQKMIDTLIHRGPDGEGIWINQHFGFGMRRLSIIDLEAGDQPISNEDESLSIVCNGEIYNYIELREFLMKKGHQFRTQSDTEVLVHLYEMDGPDFLKHLNGQFALAIWDSNKQQLVLARDRLGIRPLFYTITSRGEFAFASEMKALFQHPDTDPQIDPYGLQQIFSLWVNVPPRTIFENISEVLPGQYLVVSEQKIQKELFWNLEFPRVEEVINKPLNRCITELQEHLYDAVTLRLRADVPVAAYLSGGIDSSIISALVKKYHNNDLITFSIDFMESHYSEGQFQRTMVNHLKTNHRTIAVENDVISQVFSDVIKYAERPMIRTAPAPLFILSKLVRDNGIKVVLTGEGADEVLGGYNLFKEDKVRRFWARNPESSWRPTLLSRIYPYLNNGQTSQNFWQLFFKRGLTDVANPYYSHLIRWQSTSDVQKFFKSGFQDMWKNQDCVYDELRTYLGDAYLNWHPLSRAQYLEMKLFMQGYLLSSQGDRMMMAHSVEGRFPFLDHNLVEFASTIPPRYKLNGLKEKFILKEAYRDLLPLEIIDRPKQPYRAPIGQSFANGQQNLASELLQRPAIEATPYFEVDKVERLLKKAASNPGKQLSARDDMALSGISSLQCLHHHFIGKSEI